MYQTTQHSNRESLVLAASHRQTNFTFTETNSGVAPMLTFVKELWSTSCLAKAIIFFISNHEYLGAQAWPKLYHRINPDVRLIDSEDEQFRAGFILSAINLDISQTIVSRIGIKIQDLSGQLPNLDLINLAHHICRQETFHPLSKNQ